jgi:uncharacterized delta-60 repeat protein
MMGGRGIGARIAVAVLLLALLAAAVASAAAGGGGPGSPDPGFGKGGHVVVSLPPTKTHSYFGRIAPAAGGRFLVVYAGPLLLAEESVIERRLPDGALDRSFGHGGSVTVSGTVMSLAEEPRGGVVYSSFGTVGRLGPHGERDKAFDARASRSLEGFGAKTVAFDSSGRIVAGGSYAPGARYHPHEGEAAVRRFEPDGTPDAGFGTEGVVYLPFAEGRGEFGFLPDGSILVNGEYATHLAIDGTVLPSPELESTEKYRRGLVVFADGGFALIDSSERRPGCKITRYEPSGKPDPAFAQGGVFSDPDISGCKMSAAPEGGLLVRGSVPTANGKKGPALLLLTAAGAPAAGFGSGGVVTVPEIAEVGAGRYSRLRGAAFLSDGRIVATGVHRDGVLVGLGANGALERGFGNRGTVVQRTSLPSSAKPQSIAAEPDGELILTGVTDTGSVDRHPFWMRFGADGRLRRTAKGAPFAKTSAPLASQLRPAGQGDIYGRVKGPAIARFTRAGRLVDGFGKQGLAPLPDEFREASFIAGPDGGVTVFGAFAQKHMAVYRITAAGRPDESFGKHGLAVLPDRRARNLRAEGGALLPDGDVVLAGAAGKHLVVAEVGTDGHLRRGFGHGGMLGCRCGGARPSSAAVLFHRGSIFVLVHSSGTGETVNLIKVDTAGRLDRSFAGRGYRRALTYGLPIALFARGPRLLVVGQKGFVESSVQVRAFDLDGAVDRSYRQGATVVAASNEWEAAFRAAQEPDGRLVLVGQRAGQKELQGTRLELLGLR